MHMFSCNMYVSLVQFPLCFMQHICFFPISYYFACFLFPISYVFHMYSYTFLYAFFFQFHVFSYIFFSDFLCFSYVSQLLMFFHILILYSFKCNVYNMYYTYYYMWNGFFTITAL